MAMRGNSVTEAVEETLTLLAAGRKEALADRLKVSLSGASARTPEEMNLVQEALGPNAEVRRYALMTVCQIRILDAEKVSLTLPEGMSWAEFLQMVQLVAKDVYGRDAIYPARLEKWATDKDFTRKASTELALTIDGNVEGSTNQTRDEQETLLTRQGLQMPELSDLAVAHAAYFLADGDDLFCGNVVRARGGALYFDSNGLYVSYCYDGNRDRYCAASASLPARNRNP